MKETNVEFLSNVFQCTLSSPDVSLAVWSGSVYIVHKSKCKALLKTPSPRRAVVFVDTVFHNSNQKGKDSLILKLSHSSARRSLHTSQRLMRTGFPQPYTFSYGRCSVVTLFCYCAVQDARQVQAAVCSCATLPIMSDLSVCVFFLLWGSVGGTSLFTCLVSMAIKIHRMFHFFYFPPPHTHTNWHHQTHYFQSSRESTSPRKSLPITVFLAGKAKVIMWLWV